MKKKLVVFILPLLLLIACTDSEVQQIKEKVKQTTQVEIVRKAKSILVNSIDETRIDDKNEEVIQIDGIKSKWCASKFMENMNVGWNLGDSLGSSAKECGYDKNPNLETNWGNPKVTKELIDYVASLGFNTIRIPVSWCYNCGRDENGHLIVGPEWMNRVHEVVDYAMENDMYIILNTMCDSWELFYCGVESTDKWQQIQQDAEDLWGQIAESFKDYDEHLIFEAYNELDNIVTGWTYSDLAVEQMNVLNQIFVDSVRKTGGNNNNRILIVPTLFDSTKSNITNAFILPEDTSQDKLVITVHCYEEVFDQDIEWIFQSLEEFGTRTGAPILIGEFGTRDDYALPEWREEFTSNFIARASTHGIKCCIWDDGYQWKLIDRYNYENSNLEIIKSLFEGLNGVAYETATSKKVILDSIEDFHFGEIDLSTGVVTLVDYKTKYWASLTTNSINNTFLTVEDGDKIAITMTAKNMAVEFWIYGITFFDSDMKALSHVVGKNITRKYLCTDIPDEAVYYAVNTYDPYNNHKREQVEQYLSQGDLKITITFIDTNNIEQLYKIDLH